jgi:Flp pilus assembly protein TadD
VLYAEEAAAIAPKDSGVRLTLVRAWLVRGDTERASSEVADLLKVSVPSPETYVLDGSIRLKKGDAAGARRSFERALTLDGRSTEALTALTTLDLRDRNFAAARARMDAALRSDPDNAELLALAARAALATGDVTNADAALRRCVALSSRQVTCFALLARIYQSQQRLTALVQEYDERARSEPSNVGARLVAAVAVHTAGDVEGAERRYQEILKLDPRAALAANNLAALYVEQGTNLTYAQQLAASAVEQLPANGEVVDTLASAYLKQSMTGQAVKHFLQAVALEPGNATFHYHLGLAYRASDDPDRAREAFRRAVALNANLTAARDALAALR